MKADDRAGTCNVDDWLGDRSLSLPCAVPARADGDYGSAYEQNMNARLRRSVGRCSVALCRPGRRQAQHRDALSLMFLIASKRERSNEPGRRWTAWLLLDVEAVTIKEEAPARAADRPRGSTVGAGDAVDRGCAGGEGEGVAGGLAVFDAEVDVAGAGLEREPLVVDAGAELCRGRPRGRSRLRVRFGVRRGRADRGGQSRDQRSPS